MRLIMLVLTSAVAFCLVSHNLSAQSSSASAPVSERASQVGAQQESTILDIGNHPQDAPAIRNMVRQGVMTTDSAGRFEPDAEMTRAEFAASIQRLFNLSPPKNRAQFPDVSSSTPNQEAIEAVAPFMNRQIICFTCALSKNFFPDEPISSQEALVAVVGVLIAEKKIELLAPEEAKPVLAGVPGLQESGPIAGPYYATAIKLGIVPSTARFFPVVKSTRSDMAVLFDHVQSQFSVPAGAIPK